MIITIMIIFYHINSHLYYGYVASFYSVNFNRWYREGSATPLQAIINRGGSKDLQTTSTLTITPTREDDAAKFRCVVWNRAMADGQKLETTVTLSVNCKYNYSHAVLNY